MHKKYNTIKMLAAFAALAGNVMSANSYAQDKVLPSIELNFDVLEKLNLTEAGDNKDRKLVIQPSRPNVSKIISEGQALKEEPVTDNHHSTNEEKAESEIKAEKLPIVIRQEDEQVERLPAELSENKQIPKERSVFGKVSSFFKNIPFVSSKVGEHSKEAKDANIIASDKVSAEVQVVSAIKAENAVLDKTEQPTPEVKKQAQKKTKKKGSVHNKKDKKNEKKYSTINKKPKPLNSPVLNQGERQAKPTLPSDLPAPKKQKQKEETKVVQPEPLVKDDVANLLQTKQKKTTGKPKEEALQKSVIKQEQKKAELESDAKNADVRKTESEEIDESKWKSFLEKARKKSYQEEESNGAKKPAANEEALVPMVASQDNKPRPKLKQKSHAISKPVITSSDVSTLETKAEKSIVKDDGEGVKEPSAAEILDKPIAKLPPEIKETIDSDDKQNIRSIKTHELEPVTLKNNSTTTPVIVKEDKEVLGTLMDKLPSFTNTKDSKNSEDKVGKAPVIPEIKEIPAPEVVTPVISRIEDKTTENKKLLAEKITDKSDRSSGKSVSIDKNTEKKLGDTVDQHISVKAPPVPEPAAMSLEVSEMTPPKDAQAITIQEIAKESEKKEVKKDVGKFYNGSTNEILISVAFDNNSTILSGVDKDRLTKMVQQLSSGKRLKVMSYAHGIDGEVNSSRRISLQRAIAVRAVMVDAGLEKSRINVQAVGNNPTDQEFANSVNIYVIE